ncbi:phosphotransferase family protein [Nocardia sp. NPDC005366]|uniref:phosphotransferase family protein n=1 Tax=Nocardia sp. NPDC005366 TaxID=3156878 RepID=UPI0033A4DED2
MEAAQRRPGGGRREAWYVDVRDSAGQMRDLFLRYDRATPEEKGDPFTLHREAYFYEAFTDTDVPVPRVLGVHPTEQAILSSRVGGHPWFSDLHDEQERVAVASEFMRILAAMHRLDPHRLHLPDQDPESALPALVDHELDVWEKIYRDADAGSDPVIEIALGWLRRNRPEAAGPVVIVQGDTGPGNFLYENGRVTAVLDFEMGHLGDPHDDLAWVSLRAVQEPFTDLAARIADYAAMVPWEVDVDRIRYYRVFAELRVVILGHRKDSDRDPLAEVGNMLIFNMLHRRLLIEALAEVMGLSIEEPATPQPDEGELDWLYHAALEQIRQIIVPRSEDAFVIQRSKGLARILKYLRQTERYRSAVQTADLADLTELLGQPPLSIADAVADLMRRHADGSICEGDVVTFLGRQVFRQTAMLRPVMGILGDRHFDPLP